MKDCYDRLISDLGEVQAGIQMERAWNLIQQLMRDKRVSSPAYAAALLFQRNNYDRLLHTQCYAAIYWKTHFFTE